MKTGDVFKLLRNWYSFIEKIEYKCVGAAVYRECTGEKKNLFKNYLKENYWY